MNAFDLVLRLRQPCAANEVAGVAAEAATLLDRLLTGSAEGPR
jgi:hypothetical protein